jgi:hypothetical protein
MIVPTDNSTANNTNYSLLQAHRLYVLGFMEKEQTS